MLPISERSAVRDETLHPEPRARTTEAAIQQCLGFYCSVRLPVGFLVKQTQREYQRKFRQPAYLPQDPKPYQASISATRRASSFCANK
ncbi:hypothetical protein ACLKA6_018130 [Drosophila palustris]